MRKREHQEYWHQIRSDGNWYFDLPYPKGWVAVRKEGEEYTAYTCNCMNTNILPEGITTLEEAKAVALMIAKMS